MKKLLFLILLPTLVLAQVYQNFPNPVRMGERGRPDVSAILDVTSAIGGILGPRMTELERDAIPSPKPALFIFNTDADEYQVFNGVSWQPMGASALNVLNDVNVTDPQIDDLLKWDGAAWINSDTVAPENLEVKDRFEVTGTDSPSLPCPVVTELERDAMTPVAGDCVYNTDAATLNVYNGSDWQLVGSGGLNKWEASEDYEVDDVIWEPLSSRIYVASTAHTSTPTFNDDIANWTCLSCAEDKLDKFPAETNDNRLVRTDGDGNTLQGSVAVLDDAGALSGLTQLDVDNLRLDGNTLSSTDTDGDIVLAPNGTGSVNVDADLYLDTLSLNQVPFMGDVDKKLEGSTDFLYLSATNQFRVSDLDFIDGTITSNETDRDFEINVTGVASILLNSDTIIDGTLDVENLKLAGNTISSTDTDGDINITPDGDGEINLNGDLVNVNTDLVVSGQATIDTVEISEGLIQSGVDDLIIGTVNDGDMELRVDGDGSLGVRYDTNLYSLDPQIKHGNLISNGSFERADLSDVVCTDATAARITSPVAGENNQFALQITATDVDWSCDIIGAASQGSGNLQFLANTDGNATVCGLVNGNEQTCLSIQALSALNSYSIPSILGATSNGIRIRGATSGDVTVIDKVEMMAGAVLTNVGVDTEWESYAPTFTNFGTVVNINAWWRRAGDSMEVSATFQAGTPVGSSVKMSLPTGYIQDQSKLPSARYAIVGIAARSTLTTDQFHILAGAGETVNVAFARMGSGGLTPITGTALVNTGDFMTVNFKVPIQGWASNSQAVLGQCKGLECENVFTFYYEGTVKDQFGNSYPVTKSGTFSENKDIDVSSLSLANELRCGALGTRENDGYTVATKRDDVSTNLLLRITTGRSAYNSSLGVVPGDYPFELVCVKQGSDYKSQISIPGTFAGYARIANEGRFAEGWASFGGGSDASSCTTSPCTRYRNVSIGSNMSATRSATGVYLITSSGWKPNANISCNVNGTGRISAPFASSFIANGSGVATIGFESYVPTTGAAADTYFHVSCKGEVNP